MILGKMKETAESYLGGTVTDAVVTVPSLLQRLPTTGHKGRWHHLRLEHPPHHERAHRRRRRLRSR
jgi:hypothetical protein